MLINKDPGSVPAREARIAEDELLMNGRID
jgi:hypothetical protein